MDDVMRDVHLDGEPVLLRSGSPPPAAPPPRVPTRPERSAATVAATTAPGPSVQSETRPTRVEAPAVVDFAGQERDFRAALQVERGKVLDDARAAGHAAGLRAGQAEWSARVTELDRAIAAIRDGFDQGVAGTEDVIVEIAFEAIGKLLGSAAPTRDGVIGIVRQTLAAAREREGLVLRLAPGDVSLVEAARPHLQRSAKLSDLQIVADDRVELGGCLIETAGGGLDGRLETQLARLRDTLLAARQAGEGAP